MDKEYKLSSMMPSAQRVAAGSSMLPAARRCSHESSDIFDRIPNIQSMRCGRDLAASKNGTATNGANAFPIMRTVVELDGSGPRTIFSGAAGGFGSFHCRAAMSVPVSFTTVASSNFQRDRLWDNDCIRTF